MIFILISIAITVVSYMQIPTPHPWRFGYLIAGVFAGLGIHYVFGDFSDRNDDVC